MRATLALTLLACVSSAYAAKWDDTDNPLKFARLTGKPLTTKFGAAPLAAKLKDSTLAWSDTFWPSNRGGISYRWNAEPNPENFTYKFLTKAEVERMSVEELEKLSPAEKYDIFMGNYSFPMARKVRSMYSPKDSWWEGICHGWAPAAVLHSEPQRVNIKNRDGVVVPFGATDVKGLLSFYYAHAKAEGYVRVGGRCKVPGKVPGEAYPEDRVQTMPRNPEAKNCAGVNAGALHVVLTNMIGIQDKGFIADVDRFSDVWNQPVMGYESSVVGMRAPTPVEARNGAAKVAHMKMTMTYGDEVSLLDETEEEHFVSMDPITNTPAQSFNSKAYEYTLELDAAGNIIGGEWISETRPDFLWLEKKHDRFSSAEGINMSGLNTIYKPVSH